MIEIISTHKKWIDTLKLGFEHYDKVYIASYVIGTGNGTLFNLLKKNRSKIKCIAIEKIINSDEQNTDTINRIDDFLNSLNNGDEQVVVNLKENTFHPKVYYFSNYRGHEWLAIVGSPNFTNSAYLRNVETAVAFDQNCPSAEDVRRNIENFFREIPNYQF